jgi:hypothetical protein
MPAEMNWDKYRSYIIAATVFLVLLVFYLVSAVSSVNHAVRTFDKSWQESSDRNQDDTTEICTIPGYLELVREKAFLGAQVKMAASDSIGMLINVRDSVIQLLIKGLPVRTIRIDEYVLSPFFRRVNQEALSDMLSSPVTITAMDATFRKDPVTVKIAPKDTSEVKVDAKPDTTDFEAVFFTLNTDRNIRIYFEQQENKRVADRFARFFFDLKDKIMYAGRSLKAIATMDKPPYVPYIKIWIPKAEAKIVYRAIPREGMIVLRQ